jgi:ATP-binding cassette subfamily B protein|tara:strand:- start:4940 stop:6604 length:1665 start_codon:yes stop_codon:yes gene_type:complete
MNNNITKYNNNINEFYIYNYYKNIKLQIISGLIFGGISSYIVSYTPLLYTKITKILLNDNNNTNDNKLDIYILSYVLYKIFGNLFAGLRGYIFTKYINIISINIKKDIFELLLNKNINYYNNNDKTEIIELILHDSKKIADLYTILLNMSVRNIIHFSVITYILINKSLYLYITSLIFGIIQYYIQELYNKYFYEYSVDKMNKLEIEERKKISNYINKILTYKSLGLEENLKKKLEIGYINSINYKNNEAFYYGINFLIQGSINNSLQCLLIYIGIYINISYNIIYEFTLYINEFNNIFNEFKIIKKDFVKNKLPLKRINKIFNNNIKSEIENWGYYKYDNINDCIPTIKISDLSFKYNDNSMYIFKNLNFLFKPYSITAITGSSGSGKSTFIKLILGLYNPNNGKITIDDIPIKSFDKEYYYNNIVSYIGQEPELLEEKVKDNILIKNKEYDEILYNKIKNILCLDIDFNKNIENLSGGQKQRIAIFRGLIKKPKLLLLDEPTSALDSKNEEKLLNLINNVSYEYNITVIIITHKKKTLNICRNIIDFDKIII